MAAGMAEVAFALAGVPEPEESALSGIAGESAAEGEFGSGFAAGYAAALQALQESAGADAYGDEPFDE